MNRPANPVPEELDLPTEILATIINELASDTAQDNDKTLVALAACRLASRTLCSLATPPFFSSIRLTDRSLSNRAKNLDQMLGNDGIANSVKTLRLHCYKDDSRENRMRISKILRRLPHIQTFALKAFHSASAMGIIRFHQMAKEFRSAIQALCKSPNLTTLTLHYLYGFPITVIAACPNLRHLRLRNAEPDFDDADSTDETLRLQPRHLDSLEIDPITLSPLWPHNYRSFANIFCTRLRNLQIKNLFYNDAVMNCGWNIILSASQTLTALDLAVVQSWCVYFELEHLLEDGIPLDLGRLPALRHFKFRVQIRPEKDAHLLLLEFLNQLLSTSTPSSGIETLEIDIIYDSLNIGCGKDLFLPDAGWSRLDNLFTSEKFVSLRKVVLGLDLSIAQETMNLESERNLTLPYLDALFPMFRSLADTHPVDTQRTLEIHYKHNYATRIWKIEHY